MNGVHCHTSDASTASSGVTDSQSGCGASWLPNRLHTQVRVPLIRPYEALYSACFHSSADATGTTRNGVISRVRTTPRPRNLRSSSSARPSPSTRLTSTTVTVSTTVVDIDERSCGSVNSAR